MALWGGRFSKDTDKKVADYTESISYDCRLYAHDIRGSIAHVMMLGRQKIVPAKEVKAIIAGLEQIQERINAGKFVFKSELEDIHMNIESALIADLPGVGGKVHTGRSRNDQVQTDLRLYLRDEVGELVLRLAELQKALVLAGEAAGEAVMPGFTHLQHAQPVLLAHHLLAYVEMFGRDIGRLEDCRRRFNRCPLGAGALAGSTLPLDREYTAELLGFDGPLQNSMDAVADRDYLVELLSGLSIIAIHASRLCEDIILWMTPEFGFIELDDAFTTGSSLMPQKKNPDVAEISRGKAGRVVGSLVGLLMVLKGLPLTYNRDLQEDKEGAFDAIDTIKAMLEVLAAMIATAKFNAPAMAAAAADPALMATDLAEWLVRQGVPFRDAHHQVGRFVAWCRENRKPLDQVTLAEMRQSIPEAKKECLGLFSARKSVESRNLTGGTAPKQVARQLKRWKEQLELPKK